MTLLPSPNLALNSSPKDALLPMQTSSSTSALPNLRSRLEGAGGLRSASAVGIGRRGGAGSIKAIMSSRHANTGRKDRERGRKLVRNGDKVKARYKGQWAGEMVVVKVYDQTDSLRNVLERPARIHPLKEDELVKEIPCSETGVEKTGKRKREDDGEDEQEEMLQAVKKRRIGEELNCENGIIEEGEGLKVETTVELLIPTKKTSSNETVFTPRNSNFQPFLFRCGHPLIDT